MTGGLAAKRVDIKYNIADILTKQPQIKAYLSNSSTDLKHLGRPLEQRSPERRCFRLCQRYTPRHLRVLFCEAFYRASRPGGVGTRRGESLTPHIYGQ